MVAAIPTMILGVSGALWWMHLARVRTGGIALILTPVLALRPAHKSALTLMLGLQTKTVMFAGSTLFSHSGALVMMMMTSLPP